ncbi:mechanosensitive ion channel-like protein [Aquabacterium commune]|uniref:Small-conductance mechanosensitive channel n=2 Tax=Aquabacterium commune TaxID=70586 RepID=A0A4R6RJ66_9BURK|nr:mechanosensitive ion channel-like protein [Aquabacterium commune]
MPMTAILAAIFATFRTAMWLCLLWAAGVHAQALPADAVQPKPALPEAVLRHANRDILTLQTPYLGMPPSERVRRAQANIDLALERGGPGELSTRATPQGQLVFVDGVMALILFEGDVAPMSGDTLAALTERTLSALRQAIRETQEGRSAHSLLVSLGRVALATVLAVALFAAARFVRLRSLSVIVAFLDRQTRKLAQGEVLRRERLHQWLNAFDVLVSWGLGLLLGYAWLSFSMQQFPYTRPWGEGLHQYLISVALGLGKGMLSAVPGLVVAVLILLMARGAVGALGSFFQRVERGQLSVGWLRQDAAGPTRRVVTWLLWVFALAMAYPYLPGAETEAFKGMSVLVGVMMSLGASNFVGQVAGGLILTYSNVLRRGEYVRIGEHEGTVVDIGAFNTRIRTGLGEEVILPNASIVGNATKNYSRAVHGPGYVVDTVVTIGYDTPWRQVEAMLVEAATRTPGVLATPAPRVFQTALSDFYPEYRLVCQAIPEQPRPRAEVLSALHAHIQDVFNEHGVQIMSPHYVLDPAEAKMVPPARWYAAPARPPADAK